MNEEEKIITDFMVKEGEWYLHINGYPVDVDDGAPVEGTLKAISKLLSQQREQVLKILRAVETIAEDEEKHKFTEHCSCLRYAIWRVENPDVDEMVYASQIK